MNSQSEAHEIEESKTTRITFYNPEYANLPRLYDGSESVAAEHFEAMQRLKQEIGPSRNWLFGEIAVGIQQLEEDGDPSRLLEIYTKLVAFVPRDSRIEAQLGRMER